MDLNTTSPDLFETTFAEQIKIARNNSYKSGVLENISEKDEYIIGLFCGAVWGDYVGDCDINHPDYLEFPKVGSFIFGISDNFLCLVYVGDKSEVAQEYAAHWLCKDQELTDSCLAWIEKELREIYNLSFLKNDKNVDSKELNAFQAFLDSVAERKEVYRRLADS